MTGPVNDMDQSLEQTDFAKMAVFTLAAVFLLGGAVLIAFKYSQKQSSGIILPGGITYTGSTPTPASNQPTDLPSKPTSSVQKFSAPENDTWKTKKGATYPYSLSFPASLKLVVFPNDKTDAVALDCCNIPAHQNILLNIELLDEKDPQYQEKNKMEYVRNWYTSFSGLKGIKKVERFTNSKNLSGYRALYLNSAGEVPNVNIFFEVPKRPSLMIHLANGLLDDDLFERIVDSVNWTASTSSSNQSNLSN